MKSNPLVTAIIPVYNRPHQIIEAVDSVINQSYRPIELIIGDDGSSDETLENIKAHLLGIEDEQFTINILEFPHSGYPGKVRNLCVQKARGELIAFLDSDDIWRSEKLSMQVPAFVKDSELQISHTREEWNRAGKIISQKKLKHKREGMIFEDALKKCIIGPSTVMMRRECYLNTEGFRGDLEIAEDYEYWLRLCALYEVHYIDQALIVKRAGHGGQLSEKYGQIEIFRIQGLKDLVDHKIFQEPLAQMAMEELILKCRVYANGAKKRGREADGEHYEQLAQKYEKK